MSVSTGALYDFWDKELTQAVMKDAPGFWWGGWTHVQRTRSEYEKDAARWKEEGTAMFVHLASESLQFACEDVYKNPTTGTKLSEEAAANGGVVRIDDNLFESWKREMLSKMLVAGARTAIVINSILSQREAGQLHSGSGVAELEDEDERAAKAVKASARRNGHPHAGHAHTEGVVAFVANLAIFIAVWAIFMYTVRTWQGSSAIEAASKAKSQNTGKGT